MKKSDKKIHNKNKKKHKVKHMVYNVWNYTCVDDEFVNRLVENTTPCSCPMCGNPRKHFNQKTLKEKINLINYEEGIDEYITKNNKNL